MVTRLAAQMAESQLAIANRKKAAEKAKQDLQAAQAAQRAAQNALTQEHQNLKVAREKQSTAELRRKSAAEARDKAVAKLGEAEKNKKAADITAAKEALVKAQQELTKADQDRDATSQKLRTVEKLISECANKVQNASNLLNRQREAADRAQRESAPPQNLLKQISETTVALKAAQANLDARRAVASKLTREKQRR